MQIRSEGLLRSYSISWSYTRVKYYIYNRKKIAWYIDHAHEIKIKSYCMFPYHYRMSLNLH